MAGAAQRPLAPSTQAELLSTLASSIIHRISDPLSVIIGNAQYLLLSLEGRNDDEAEDLDELTSTVQTILSEGMKLAAVASLLMHFSSRLGARKKSDVDANKEVERLLSRLNPEPLPHRPSAPPRQAQT